MNLTISIFELCELLPEAKSLEGITLTMEHTDGRKTVLQYTGRVAMINELIMA